MNIPQAIFAGCALLAGALYFGLSAETAAAQRGGPFAIAAHQNNNVSPGVFRMDLNSGEINYCFVRGTSAADSIVVCTKNAE